MMLARDNISSRAVVHWGIRITAIVPILTGVFWVGAWLIGMAPRWSAEGVLTVKANTALLMIFAGSALLLLAVKDALGWRRRAGALLSTLIFLIGSLTLSEHLFGWNLGIDQLLAKEAPGAISTVSPNRMGPPASVCNIIIGAALLLVSFRRLTAVPYMGLAVCIINIIPAVGFLYNIQQFYTTPHLTHIAWPTVIALMCLGTGLVLSQPQSNPLSMLLNDNAGGRLLRQMLPLVILVPLMLGFLRVMGENRGLGDIGTGTGLLVIAIILVFSVILWRSAGKLSYADAAHREDEEALASSALFPEENPNPVLRIGTDGQMLYTNAAARKFLSHEGWMPGVPVPHVLSVLVEEALHSNQVGQFDFLSQVDRVFSFFCVPIPDKHYANLYGWDITDRKMAEDALKESEEKFKSLAENIPSVLQRFDRQFRVVYLSPKAEEATGIPAEKFIGKSNREMGMPEHLVDMWDEAMTHVFETAEPRNLEFSINTPQGNRSFLLRLAPEFAADNKTVEYLLGVSTDITELKKAEEALLEAEVHKRDFYRKTILAATGGKLEVVEPQDILALQGDLIEKWRIVTAEDYTLTREQAVKLAGSCGLEADLLNGLTACAGEMLSNALKYAGGGEASLYRTDSSILFIVSDTGPGIDSVNVPDIAFVRGYTTAGTGGLGYKLIIACADKTYLATGSGGTIVAVEMRLSKLSPLQGIAHSDLSVGLG